MAMDQKLYRPHANLHKDEKFFFLVNQLEFFRIGHDIKANRPKANFCCFLYKKSLSTTSDVTIAFSSLLFFRDVE